MPTLGNALDFSKYEARNIRVHVLGAAPSSPVTGQLYYDSGTNTLFYWNGSSWISAAGGTPPDATASVKGVLQLAGDLAGTAASPQIAAGAVVNADVNASAAIAESKLSLATDAAAGTGSRRTIGNGALQAMAGNSGLDTIAFNNPALSTISANSQKIVNLADPTVGTDAATKTYVDNAIEGLAPKDSCKAATTANIANLATGAPNTLDGVTLAQADRVLVKDQTTQAQNGIYIITTLGTGANGVWSRAADMSVWAEVPSAFTWVEQGTTNADTGWYCSADQGGTLGTTAITWTQFSAASEVSAGTGLSKSGSVISLVVPVTVANGGTGQTTAKAARETGMGAAGYYSSATHGAGTTITITQATHGLRSSRGLVVQVLDEATGAVEIPDITVAASGDVTVTYGNSVTANSKRVTIVG